MVDERLPFLGASLAPVPGLRALSEENPISFTAGAHAYSAHLCPVHDAGEDRFNADEQRIQVPHSVIETQERRRRGGYVVLFLGFFAQGDAFSAWEPGYVLSQRPCRNGSVYPRGSDGRLVVAQGAAVRVVANTCYLGRSTSVLTLPPGRLCEYLSHRQPVHRATTAAEVRRIVGEG